MIPKSLQQEMLRQIHSGHQGVHKCKERARCSIWWPGITAEIEEYIKNCRICCRFQRPIVEPLCPSHLPETPWEKLGVDLFKWRQSSYLIVVDYYSRFIEIAKLTSTTSSRVIDHLKSIFARHGIPQILVSDNGPQFSSSDFAEFAKEFHFKHATSSPRYPQANGEAERAVQTVKGLLNRSEDPYMALLAYRATPLKLGYSPAELLMGRRIRTTLPLDPRKLQVCPPKSSEVRRKDNKLKETQKRDYDKRHRASEQPILEPGDEVWVTDRNEPGEVEKNMGSRSYSVLTPTGTFRRNRLHLNQFPPSQDTANRSSGVDDEQLTNPRESTPNDSNGVRRSSRTSRSLVENDPPG